MSATTFETKVVVEGSTVLATFVGEAEADDFESIAKFVAEVQSATGRAGANRVVADIRDLSFATSSCLKVLAGWVIDVEEAGAAYTVEFLSNVKHHWQRRSLQALAACAPGVVQVSVS